MKTFVISLPDEKSRRDFMRMQLEKLGMEYEFFDAIRGSERSGDARWYDDIKSRRLEGRSLSPGEIGCALSHSGVYRRIVDLDVPMALILEDDATLRPDVPSVVDALESGIIKQGELVTLSRCDHFLPWGTDRVFGDYRVVDPIFIQEGSIAQAVGYIITRDAAIAIKDANVPVHFPADSWGHYGKAVRLRGLVPTLKLVTQNVRFESTTTGKGSRPPFRKYSIAELLWHGFTTYNFVGKTMWNLVKKH